jgi:hypothetical protein
LTSGTKLTAAQGQEVWAVTDLTTYDGTSGTGSTALLATLTGLATGDLLKWSGTNWVNTASAAKADALTNDPTDCGANQYATGIAASGNLTCSQPATSNLSDGANVVKNNQTNTYSTGTQDFESASVTRPFRRLAYASFPGSCTANREFLERSDPGTAGQVLYVCNSGGNGWDLVGDGGAGGGVTSLDTLTGAVTMANGTTGTAPNWTHATTIDTLNIPMALTASVTAGLLSKTDYDAFTAKPSLVGSGTAGVGPAYIGTATTAARSDHDHRGLLTKTWFFPGTPPTGLQNLVLTFPEGGANFAITDMRVTVNTVSASSSTFNIQRCVVSSVACSATQNTWVDIYSAVLTLAASNYTVAKGSAPNQNVGSLVGGDRFRASLVTIGTSLADVTVAMTYKVNTAN